MSDASNGGNDWERDAAGFWQRKNSAAPSSFGGADGSAEHPYDYDPPPLVPDRHLKCFSRELLIESARRWMRHHAEGCSQEWHMARLGLLVDFVTDLYDGKIPPNTKPSDA